MDNRFFQPGTIAVLMSVSTPEGRKWVKVPNFIDGLSDFIDSSKKLGSKETYEQLTHGFARYWYSKLKKEKSLKLLFINFVQRCVTASYFGRAPSWFSTRLNTKSPNDMVDDYYNKARRIVAAFLVYRGDGNHNPHTGLNDKIARAAGHLLTVRCIDEIREIVYVEPNQLRQKQAILESLDFKQYSTLFTEARPYENRYKSIWDIIIAVREGAGTALFESFLCQDLVLQFIAQVNFTIDSPYDYTDELLMRGLNIPKPNDWKDEMKTFIDTWSRNIQHSKIALFRTLSTFNSADMTTLRGTVDANMESHSRGVLTKDVIPQTKINSDTAKQAEVLNFMCSIIANFQKAQPVAMPRNPNPINNPPNPINNPPNPINNPPDPVPPDSVNLNGPELTALFTKIKPLVKDEPSFHSAMDTHKTEAWPFVASSYCDAAPPPNLLNQLHNRFKKEIKGYHKMWLTGWLLKQPEARNLFGQRMNNRYRNCNRSGFGRPVDLNRMTGYVRPYNTSAMEDYTGYTDSMYNDHISRSTGAPYGGTTGPISQANSYYGNYRNGERLNPGSSYGRRNYSHRPGIRNGNLPGSIRRRNGRSTYTSM
jgi:hypothetical protein